MASSAAKNPVPATVLEILKHEGVVAIVTQSLNEAHLVNTWNSYITVTPDGRLLYPAGGMKVTEENLSRDNRVQLTLGSREVEGQRGRGAGFLIRGTASFKNGAEYQTLKTRFPWARAAVEIKIDSATQTL